MTIICFHNPDEENGYLSNWYSSKFTIHNIQYTSMEQYMMFQKAITFQDYNIAFQILQTNDVATIKQLGRQVSNYNDHLWNGVRQIIIYNGLLEKFRQNNELKENLLNTNDAILAECAVHDHIWGIGLSMHDSDRFDMNKWNGTNLLGYALMQVRSHL